MTDKFADKRKEKKRIEKITMIRQKDIGKRN